MASRKAASLLSLASSTSQNMLDENDEILVGNLEALDFENSVGEVLARDQFHGKYAVKYIRVVTWFLLHTLDKEKASKQFRRCWPITDGPSEREFRDAVAHWLAELVKEMEAAEFLSTNFVPRMLIHPASHQYRALLAQLSTFVLYRHLSTLTKLEFHPSVAPGMPVGVKMASMEQKTSEMNAQTVELVKESQAAYRRSVGLLSKFDAQCSKLDFEIRLLMARNPGKQSKFLRCLHEYQKKHTAEINEVVTLLEAIQQLQVTVTASVPQVFDGSDFVGEGSLDMIRDLLERFRGSTEQENPTVSPKGQPTVQGAMAAGDSAEPLDLIRLLQTIGKVAEQASAKFGQVDWNRVELQTAALKKDIVKLKQKLERVKGHRAYLERLQQHLKEEIDLMASQLLETEPTMEEMLAAEGIVPDQATGKVRLLTQDELEDLTADLVSALSKKQ